tara:strand:- start:336 stop:530 length:195 start_codon:yes stop_codon:yes gene_type:complete
MGTCAILNQLDPIFWPILVVTSILMQKDIRKIFKGEDFSVKNISNHFSNQVIYGILILLGIIIS